MELARRISELPAAPLLGDNPRRPKLACLRRALAAAALGCAVAAGGASAQESDPTPHDRHAGEEAGGHVRGAEAGTAPVALDLPQNLRDALVEEMRAVQRDTLAIAAAIPLADWSAVEEAALRIRASYILERTLSAEDRAALGKALPEGFVLLDQRFHEDAAHLAEAARASRADTAVFYASRLFDGCTSCHARYAGARFPGFRAASDRHAH